MHAPNPYLAGLRSGLAAIAKAEPSLRLKVFTNIAREVGGYVRKGGVERADVEQKLLDAALNHDLIKLHGRPTIEAILADAMADEEAPSAPSDDVSTPPALPFINVAAWDGQPIPERIWAVPDLIPAANVALLSGHGSTGKTTLALQLCIATVLGRGWLNYLPEPGPAMIVCCEDDAAEIHRRVAAIVSQYGAGLAELRDLHPLSLAGQDAILAAPDRAGVIRPTPLFDQLRQEALATRPRLIVLDNAADVYAGNENERGMVRQFITLLRGLAIETGAAVMLTLHPSLTGIASGTGISGNTAWFNSVRAQLYLKPATTESGHEPDKDLRELEARKNNYGPVADSTMLRWRNGAFAVEGKVGGLDKLAAEKKAEDVFLSLLERFDRQGQRVSDKRGTTFAPAAFAEHPDAKGVPKQVLAKAMQRLLDANKIRVEEDGPPSHRRSRLVLA